MDLQREKGGSGAAFFTRPVIMLVFVDTLCRREDEDDAKDLAVRLPSIEAACSLRLA